MTTFKCCGHPKTVENTYRTKRPQRHGDHYWTDVCQLCRKARNLAWSRKTYQARRPYLVQRLRQLETGWTAVEYDGALHAQGGLCAICEQPDTRDLSADHDHAKPLGLGQRALLCRKCNSLLASADEDPYRLVRAANYLDHYARAGGD